MKQANTIRYSAVWSRTVALAALATALATAAVSANAGDLQTKDYEYRGDLRASAICQAIVQDNPGALRSQLRKASREQRNIAFQRINKGSFECNGESLEAFAQAVDARRSVAFLNGDTAQEIAQN